MFFVDIHRGQDGTHIFDIRLVVIFPEMPGKVRALAAVLLIFFDCGCSSVDREITDQTVERLEVVLFEHLKVESDQRVGHLTLERLEHTPLAPDARDVAAGVLDDAEHTLK